MDSTPLAERLRPKTLKDFVGQEKLVGPEGIITKLLRPKDDQPLAEYNQTTSFFPSLILWGPPGSGKTTLARIIANELKRTFYEFSAVNAKVKEIEEVALKAKQQKPQPDNQELLTLKGRTLQGSTFKGSQFLQSAPIVFLDEIHRFNKAQQDKLLPHVERGDIVLIGATTENPSFEVIGPLLSRCRVLIMEQLSEKGLKNILKRALKQLSTNRHPEFISGSENKKILKPVQNDKLTIDKKAEEFLLEASNGDARVLLNVLEIASQITDHGSLVTSDIESALQRRQYTFDKRGEDFYNVISAFIKSMRASDVNAALYYLARMIEAGQDPLYIARRMVVFASEDIGMAQPTALVVANEVFRACETIGYPECQENLAHGVVYLAAAKKDRTAYNAYMSALGDVRKFGNLPVPMKIRNPVTKLMKQSGYGEGYDKYTEESLLPEKLKGKIYYQKS